MTITIAKWDLVCLVTSLLVMALIALATSWAPLVVSLLATLAAYTVTWLLLRRLTASLAGSPLAVVEVSRWEEPAGSIPWDLDAGSYDDAEAGSGGRLDDSDPDAVWSQWPAAPESSLVAAARLVIDSQFGSAAHRLMDALYEAGIVGPSVGSHARDVLVPTFERDSALRRLTDRSRRLIGGWLDPDNPR